MIDDRASLPSPAPGEAVPEWITAAQLAQLAGIAEQNARNALSRCADGGTWRKHALHVRTREDGPASARNPYLVHVHSLPPALSVKYLERAISACPPAPVKLGPVLPMPERIDPNAAKRYAEMQWKLKILAPALEFEEGSPGRAQRLREIAGQTHTGPDGKPKRVKLRTLQEWITRIKRAKSVDGLLRRARLDKPNRNIISRAWDKACPLPLEAKWAIERDIQTYVRSLWAEGSSWKQIEELASSKLMEASRAGGWTAAAYELCRVGRHYVEKHSETRILAIEAKDAKRWHDQMVPRVKRTREGLRPGDIVVGDVHPIDVIVLRSDGSEATFRLIAWLDIATDDVFGTPVLLPPGKGITQAHVAASFAAMVDAWGLPRLLMLDNGAEYSWRELERGFMELAMLARGFKQALEVMVRDDEDAVPITGDDGDSLDKRDMPILRALPHRPASKPIEGIFAVLEQTIMRAFPGWIGGDRMNKKTHQMGKGPTPFPGTPEAFEEAFFKAMRYWRARERGKAWGGRSVNQVRSAFQNDGGLLPPSVPREALVFALSETLTRKVGNWGVEVGGEWYQSPTLLKYAGQNVTIRYAKWAPDYVFMLGEANAPVLVPRKPVYGYTDGEGARQQAVMNKILNAHVRELKTTTRKVDVLSEMSRHVDAVGEDVPVLKGPEILLSPELSAATEAARLPSVENEATTLGYGEVLDRKSGEIVSILPDHYSNRHREEEADDEDDIDWAEVAARFTTKEGLGEGATSPSPDEAIHKTGTNR